MASKKKKTSKSTGVVPAARAGEYIAADDRNGFLTKEGLTLKEAAFCRALFEARGNAKAAYAQAYDVADPNATWIEAEASKLLKRPHIGRYLRMLVAGEEDEAAVTVRSVLFELRKAYELAEVMLKPGEMIQAAMGRAKLCGLLVDRKEIAFKSEREMSRDELLDEMERAQREAAEIVARARAQKS